MAKCILLIDDDICVLEEVLTANGFHTFTLTQTDKVFEAIAEHQPELVLIDYLLQGINGGEYVPRSNGIKNNTYPRYFNHGLSTVLLSLGTY
jgi:DNA-binding NtrC family response regulator